MEIVLCTLGTRGDINPFLVLSQALITAGYPVTLLSNDNWREAATSTGAEFFSIAPRDDPQSDRDDHQFFLNNTLPSFRMSYNIIAQKVKNTRQVALIYRVNMLGMQCAAEKFGLLNGRVALQPSVIRSYLRPPWPMTVMTQGKLRWLGSKIVVPALYKIFEVTSPFRQHSNKFRSSVGLSTIGIFGKSVAVEDFVLMMCPDWFAMPQLDWSPHVHMVGFPFTQHETPDERLADFIQTRGPPIVFTPGTGVTDTASFFSNAAAALEVMKAPGVFLSPHIPPEHRTNPLISCQAFGDLGWLLPRARALVHHGGIGTTAQALRAGIPQMVIPGRFDQPDNAMRVATLGLGSAILSNRHSGQDWCKLLGATLESDYIRNQCSRARAHLLATDAAAESARLVDMYIRRRFEQSGESGLSPQESAYEVA